MTKLNKRSNHGITYCETIAGLIVYLSFICSLAVHSITFHKMIFSNNIETLNNSAQQNTTSIQNNMISSYINYIFAAFIVGGFCLAKKLGCYFSQNKHNDEIKNTEGMSEKEQKTLFYNVPKLQVDNSKVTLEIEVPTTDQETPQKIIKLDGKKFLDLMLDTREHATRELKNFPTKHSREGFLRILNNTLKDCILKEANKFPEVRKSFRAKISHVGLSAKM